MPVRYRLDPAQGQFTVKAFAAGLLSALGHSPSFAVGRYAGFLRFPGGQIGNLSVDLTVEASSLSLVDRVSPSDRAEIEARMHRDVLATAAHPEITYRADCFSEQRVEQGHHRLSLAGPLSIRGVSTNQPIDLDLYIFGTTLKLRGGGTVRLSDFRIAPVTALAGSIRLKDELAVLFDVAAIEEEES